jgi:hypothetical protein
VGNGDGTDVKIAGDAIDVDGGSILPPTQALLRGLGLLPDDEELKKAGKFTAAFTGPPDSVSIIEAGATAASKWWATAIGAGATAISTRIATLWEKFDGPLPQAFALLSVGVVLGSAALGIAYLLASDVRGRASAMVATIEARRDVAIEMAGRAAAASGSRPPGTGLPTAIGPLDAENAREKGTTAESGWKAIAMRESADGVQYLLVKEGRTEWIDASDVSFS